MKLSKYQQNIIDSNNILENETQASDLLAKYQSFCQEMKIYFDHRFWQKKLQIEKNDLFCNFIKLKWKNDLKKLEELHYIFNKSIDEKLKKDHNNYLEHKNNDDKFLSKYKKIQKKNYFEKYYIKISEYENNCSELFLAQKEHLKNKNENLFQKIISFLNLKNRHSSDPVYQLLKEYKDFCYENNHIFDKRFWNKKINSDEKSEIIYKDILTHWAKELDNLEFRWKKFWISSDSKFLTKWGDSLLNHIDHLFESGISFGNEIKNITPQGLEFLKELNNKIKKNKKIKDLLNSLGRSFQKRDKKKVIKKEIKKEIRKEIEKEIETIEKHNPIIDYHAKEEITGIYLSKELENILPAELALLNNEESAVLFDLKFLENKLMCFQQQGTTLSTETEYKIKHKEIEKEVEIEVEVEVMVENEKLGPVVLCIDTSGSMMGDPENIAKAIALYLGQEAKAQKRAYFIINFSKQIVTYEHTKRKTIENLISFLQGSFHGGTDVEPALNYALDLLQRKNYAKADVLVISDFEIPPFSLEIHEKIEMQKQKKTKFNALAISSQNNINSLLSIFDNQWKYSPTTGEIIDLTKPTSSP
ncbi:VWA domain-containing protein [Gallibacterium anatis]|uniref:VWA domain containing CoxE-like protein n=2 Tax=Gallibacterium TaxID=155493 RepID=A0A0A2Y2D7_9PAST|nr:MULTISPECIES: VWA domain-containing protein [Gallibacterium]KGQ36765.1 VWA domain containing CoxE-like protein [Gallibacterium genomosp. 1]UZD16414.1 VWA domain-containing protein [Gallibacterium anatis]